MVKSVSAKLTVALLLAGVSLTARADRISTAPDPSGIGAITVSPDPAGEAYAARPDLFSIQSNNPLNQRTRFALVRVFRPGEGNHQSGPAEGYSGGSSTGTGNKSPQNVPEPSSLLLLGASLGWVLAFRKR